MERATKTEYTTWYSSYLLDLSQSSGEIVDPMQRQVTDEQGSTKREWGQRGEGRTRHRQNKQENVQGRVRDSRNNAVAAPRAKAFIASRANALLRNRTDTIYRGCWGGGVK